MEQGHIHQCRCADCRKRTDNATKLLHARLNYLLSTLDERQRRLFVGLESSKLGYGGDRRLAGITGMSANTIARGRRELQESSADQRIRKPGGGRPAIEKKRRTFALPSNTCSKTTRLAIRAAHANGNARVSGT